MGFTRIGGGEKIWSLVERNLGCMRSRERKVQGIHAIAIVARSCHNERILFSMTGFEKTSDP
jgi:hypothetical protein